jgi:hypothetical protein
MVVASNGVKNVKADDFNWAAILKRKREINTWLKPSTAKLWLKLYKQGDLPQFCASQITLDEMQLAAI